MTFLDEPHRPRRAPPGEPPRVAGKRGMLPYRPNSILFKFGDYLVPEQLPNLPAAFGHIRSQPPGGWGIDANDSAGCCVIAGFNHETIVYAIATRRPIPKFTDHSTLADYSRALVAGGGAPYDPLDPSTDSGLDILAASDWRRKVGLTDADGTVHKSLAYTEVDTPSGLLYAARLFGAGGVGLALPSNAEQKFEDGVPWNADGSPEDGHYVPIIGRNSHGNFVCVTWGCLQAITPDAVRKFMIVGVATFSEEYLLATGLSPEAINRDRLFADLNALTRR